MDRFLFLHLHPVHPEVLGLKAEPGSEAGLQDAANFSLPRLFL